MKKFNPFPWRNRSESETTPLDRQNLNAAEEDEAAYAQGVAEEAETQAKSEVEAEKTRAQTAEAANTAAITAETAARKTAVTGAETAAAAGAKAAEEAAISNAATKATIARNEAEAASVPLSSKGKANGVAELDSEGHVPLGEMSLSMVTGSLGTPVTGGSAGQVVTVRSDGTLHYFTPAAVSARAWGVVADGVTDDSVAIQEADAAANGKGVAVQYPEGTILYKKTLSVSAPWLGDPRKTIFKRTAEFTYGGLENQFSITNAHASTTYNPATADTVVIRGIDFQIEGTAEAGKGALGLANVASLELADCHFKTNGTNAIGALIDLYACVKNFKLDVQCENLTQAKTGGNVWIRNLAAKPEEASQATENGYISPRSRFVTTTGDEAIAIYGVFGKVKDILVDGAILEGGASAEKHQRLASTFPSALAEKPFAAVENVEWRKCKFIDVEGTIKENGEVLGIGRGTGTEYLCQNIKHVDCAFRIKATAPKVVATRNIPSKFEGGTPGIKAVRPYINAEGSPEPLSAGLLEFHTVEGGTTVGNLSSACKRCNTVTGGSWEATEKVFYDCNSVGGDYKAKIPNATGIALFREANTGEWSGIAAYGKGETVGGKQLLVIRNTVEAGNTINLRGATITTTAEEGNVIETPTSGSIPTVNLTGNFANGPKELARKGTFAQAEGNTWYGVLDAGPIKAEAITAEKIAKEAVETEKIKNEAVTSAKLATGSVSAAKLAAEAVESGKIKAEAVTEAKIAKEAVNTEQIKNLSVTSAKLAVGSVTEEKLAAEAVAAGKIKGEAVTAAKIKAEAVEASKVKPAEKPGAPAGENEVAVGAAGVLREVIAIFMGNGAETKVKIKHGLKNIAAVAVAQKGASGEQPTTALGKWTNNSIEEGTYTFTAAPAAKEEIRIMVFG